MAPLSKKVIFFYIHHKCSHNVTYQHCQCRFDKEHNLKDRINVSLCGFYTNTLLLLNEKKKRNYMYKMFATIEPFVP